VTLSLAALGPSVIVASAQFAPAGTATSVFIPLWVSEGG
jgi:hypothetical protein